MLSRTEEVRPACAVATVSPPVANDMGTLTAEIPVRRNPPCAAEASKRMLVNRKVRVLLPPGGSTGSTPATVRTLIDQLGDPDYRRRDIAAHSLRKIPEARAALIKELLACEEPSKAWSIAELLATYEGGKWRGDALDGLWKRLEKAIEAEERIQSSFLHVLKQADGEYVYEKLSSAGARLIKGKKYKEAVPFLLPLKDFPDVKPEDKFRLALGQLKAHGQRRQSAVELLSELYRNSAFPLFEVLKKEKRLAAEELFNLGFVFAERQGDERSLGKSLLEHVAISSPRTKIGKSAKNKLKLLT